MISSIAVMRNFSIVIADASGKGVPAALLVAQIQAMLHSEVQNKNELSNLLKTSTNMSSLPPAPKNTPRYFMANTSPENRIFKYSNAEQLSDSDAGRWFS